MRKIKLQGIHSKGKYALVDDEDYERCIQYRWNVNRLDYPTRGVKTDKGWRSITMHRFIMGFPKTIIDHINRNPLDNQKSNLRFCTHKQNKANTRQHIQKKYKGVCKYRAKFIARLYHNGASHNLGVYKTEKEAAIAYNNFAKQVHGEFAYLNKI